MFAPNYRRKVLQRSQKGNHGETPRIAPVVLTSDGEYVTIEAVRPIHYKTPQTTYNFEVEGFHTYYVGNGVLVHNMNGGGCHSKTVAEAEEVAHYKKVYIDVEQGGAGKAEIHMQAKGLPEMKYDGSTFPTAPKKLRESSFVEHGLKKSLKYIDSRVLKL